MQGISHVNNVTMIINKANNTADPVSLIAIAMHTGAAKQQRAGLNGPMPHQGLSFDLSDYHQSLAMSINTCESSKRGLNFFTTPGDRLNFSICIEW